jgi:phosphate starvation-inducible PhoH-like protein
MSSLARYLTLLKTTKPAVVLATGPAGTSKTYTACSVGSKSVLAGTYDKLILTRPTVTVDGEMLGYLPGTLDEKMQPWIQPCVDAIGTPAFRRLNQAGKIEICPMAFMRGRTFENCFIVADEMQNATPQQLMMILTRIGFDSKLVLTGDVTQADRPDGGLVDLLRRVETSDSLEISQVKFDASEIRRHPVVKDILSLYEKNIRQ